MLYFRELHHSPPPYSLFDSGVAQLITKDMGSLSIKEEYHGTDYHQFANGNHLSIINISLTTISNDNPCLKLSNILYVPNISQNLIFVSQLCQTNKVSIEIFLWHFEVKDLYTKEMYLRRLNEDNMYRLKLNALVTQTFFFISNTSYIDHYTFII